MENLDGASVVIIFKEIVSNVRWRSGGSTTAEDTQNLPEYAMPNDMYSVGDGSGSGSTAQGGPSSPLTKRCRTFINVSNCPILMENSYELVAGH